MRQAEPEIKDILVVRNDRFGEFLLNIPAIRALKERFSGARLVLVVDPAVKDLAECISFADEIITWRNTKHKFQDTLKFVRSLKQKKFGLCVILNPSKEFNLISFCAGIPIRIGYDRKLGFLLNRKIKDTKHLGQKHEVEYNLDLVKLAGADTKDKTLTLTINNCLPEALGIDSAENLVAIHPFTSDPIKQWPEINFVELAKRLIQEVKTKVVVIGGEKESDRARELYGNFNERLINITGRTTLKESAAVLKRCRLLISGDSGPMHLACAVGTPVVALFRNDIAGKSPRRWGPWGEGNIVIEKNNLCDITVDEVFDKVSEILRGGVRAG
jgi:heptosyltransferase-2